MIVIGFLCILFVFPLKAEFHTTHVYVEEGKAVTLKCVFPDDDESPLQWLTSRGFVAFFNNQKVLKDRRYGLVHYSKNELIIRLSNITMQDEGIYTCLFYSFPLQNKTVYITVLGIPSKPVVGFYRIAGKSSENRIILNCSTSGSKPPPKISWLIDDSMEVFGKTKHRCENNGKTCNTTSTLRIKAFKSSATVKCIVRHKALRDGNLTTSFIFQNLSHTRDAEVTSRNLITSQFPFPITATTTLFHLTTGNTAINEEQTRTSDAKISTAIYTTGENASLSPFFNQNTSNAVETTASYNETSHNSSITYATSTSLQFTDGNTAKHDKKTTTNYTTKEQNFSSSYMETTTSYNKASNQPITSDFEVSARTSNAVLIWVSVTLMISFLMIIVNLFFLKLKKAHADWKKENETSDQTLESTKSRSNNEDATNQQRNGHVGKQGSIIQYNKEPSA